MTTLITADAPAEAATAAGRLFGAPTAPQPVTLIDPMAGRLYAEKELPARADSENIERRMFSAQDTYANELKAGSLPGVDVVGAREVAADLNATAQDAIEFQTLAFEYLTTPATDETRGTWRAYAEKIIKDELITAHDMKLARQLVARDPRLKDVLDHTGLGNHPNVVRRLVHLARSAKLAGRLK